MTATPKTIAAATKLLEEYADLMERVEAIGLERDAAIVAANQRADTAAQPMIDRCLVITNILEAWWPYAVAADVAKGKKSLQLGGCMIGSRRGKAKLAHGFDDDDKAIAAIPGRIFKQCTKIKYSLDRTGITKLIQLGGAAAKQLLALGFSLEQPDQFYIERVQQERTTSS